MRKLIYLLASAALVAGGCTQEKENPTEGITGTIRIACETDATIDAEVASAKSLTRAASTKPAGKDFTLHITGDHDFNRSWETVAAYEAEKIVFIEGRYQISVTYGDPDAEGVNKPYYAGSTEIDVLPRRTNTAAISAKIGNSQVLVRTTAAFRKFYHNAEFTVTTGAGNTFTFHPNSETEEESIWIQAGKGLTVAGTAQGQSQDGISEGPTYTFSPEPLTATRPTTRHIFTFDTKNAGSATLTITLGEGYTETRSLNVELNKEAID